MLKKYYNYLPAAIWAGIVMRLSLMPGKSLPRFNFWDIIAPDKLGHFAVYALLTGLSFWGYSKANGQLTNSSRLKIAGFCTVYGIFLECLQHILTNGDRHFDPIDVVANTIGVGIAFGLYQRIVR